MRYILLLLLLPVCAAAQTATKDFSLSGALKSFKPIDKIFLNYRDGDNSVRDSALAANGSFAFKGSLSEPTIAMFVVKYTQQPGDERAKQEAVQLYLEPAKMQLTAKDSLKNYTLKGSAGHADLDRLNKAREVYTPRLEELYKQYGAARKEEKKEEMDRIEEKITAIDNEIKDRIYLDFLKKSTNSPLALYALQQYAGWEIDPDKVEPLFLKLPAAQQQQASGIAFRERIDIAKKTAVGRIAMDFTQNDTLDRPVSLSSFRGKYVLVDFWASWCGPCRQENPNVVKAFNKYNEKGFTVLGVSLDRPNAKDKWLKAIHDDQLTWTQVSDLKFWENEVAKQYGIRAIPQNLLIDPQGKIIAKNLNGEKLTKKLEEVLPK